jgi:hypothetical protein
MLFNQSNVSLLGINEIMVIHLICFLISPNVSLLGFMEIRLIPIIPSESNPHNIQL